MDPRAAPLVLGGLLLLIAAGGAATSIPRATSPLVVGISQSHYTTEQSRFTVTVQVASTANIQGVFFSFCQLSSSVCYNPVTMVLQGTNEYVGTTNAMSSYHGMTVGVLAGYNITIALTNNTTMHEPSYPNAFSSLTIGTEVGGEFMFEMTVGPDLFGLSGEVTDATTHAGLAGANVTLTPGNGTTSTTTSAGAYSFASLANGTYTVSVSEHGYTTGTATVTISGQNGVKDVAMSNGTGPPAQKSTTTKGASVLGFLTTPFGLALLAVVAVAVVAGALFTYSRKKGGAPPEAPVGTAGPGNSSN